MRSLSWCAAVGFAVLLVSCDSSPRNDNSTSTRRGAGAEAADRSEARRRQDSGNGDAADCPTPDAPIRAGAVATSGPAEGREQRPPIVLAGRLREYAAAPARSSTGTFIDRPAEAEVRVVSYNVNWDRIFPDVALTGAEKFQRVLKALNPDVLNLQEIRGRDAGEVADYLDQIAPLPDRARWHTWRGWTNVIASRYPLRATATATVPGGERDLAMALVDLPDERFATDLYVVNNHWKCCDGTANDPRRQQQADAIVNWIRDLRSPGGAVDVPAGTPIVVVGDLNIVGGPQPLATLLTGDIQDESAYGPDLSPDWDDSALTDAHPTHNAEGRDDYTWRDDSSRWPPGRLDFIIYTDSILEARHAFVLDTLIMTEDQLSATRLERFDVSLDDAGREVDHYPVVVDFRVTDDSGRAAPRD